MRIAQAVLFRTKRAARAVACYGVRHAVDFDPRENLYLFSEPRGGSTWLSELIGRVPKTAVLWEPLHLHHAPLFRDLGFSWRQRIDEGAQWDEARTAFERTFRGHTLNLWSCTSGLVDYFRAERLVVKLCRANGALPWLTEVFDFRYAPIYLVRHPFAVAASQVKWGSWDWDFEGFDAAELDSDAWFVEHADFLATLTGKHEALVVRWCQANADTLRHARSGTSWIPVHYEHLLLDPEAELTRIFEHWGLPMPDDVVQQAREASAMTKEATFERGTEAQLAKWKATFSEEQIADMLRVLHYFDVRAYSADTLPHRVDS